MFHNPTSFRAFSAPSRAASWPRACLQGAGQGAGQPAAAVDRQQGVAGGRKPAVLTDLTTGLPSSLTLVLDAGLSVAAEQRLGGLHICRSWCRSRGAGVSLLFGAGLRWVKRVRSRPMRLGVCEQAQHPAS